MSINSITKYVTDHGNVELSPEIIKSYLVPPDSKITEQEIGFFLQMCKFQKLNPFMKEIYIVKYGNFPAAFIVAKDTFLRRAKKNETYKGHTVGISEDGKTAFAEVYVDGFEVPIRCEVDYDEYVAKNSKGEVNKMWTEKPRTMLKKVALVQTLREAFPQDLCGLYERDEIRNPEEEVKEANATVQVASTKSEQKTEVKKATGSTQAVSKKTKDTKAPKEMGEICEGIHTIKNVTQKTGGDPQKPWTKYSIEVAEGSTYTTFDKKFAEAAISIKGTNSEVLIRYVVVDGKYYNLVKDSGLTLV
ncbi:MAG: phage recombination protein Bet [Colwellia sp.]|nr:phage recombination protein Bet [Colwellia sp.]